MSARTRVLMLVIACATTAVPRALARQTSTLPGIADRSQRTILFLAAEDFTRPYVRLIFEAFSQATAAAANAPAIYFESLDASRFERPQHLEDLREWLRRKYAGRRIDLIVPITEDALVFLADGRGQPWPTAQVLYLEATSVRVDTARTLPLAGGMLLDDNYAEAIRVIKAILPETERVAALYGASALEIARWSGFAGRVRDVGLEPIELISGSIEDTLARIAHLPPHTVLMILAPSVDANGQVLPPNRACEIISAAASLPVFTPVSHDLGCGTVGGLGWDWTAVGTRLGGEALARLKQPSTEVVRVPIAQATTLVFDERQLRRWGIPERRLPAGAIVRFREPSLWRDYRGLVSGAIGVTVIQSLLIAGLVFEHRRRRRAEIDSRRHLAAMAHLDRRAAMGELATSLAHELNQPLNAILQNAGVAQMLLASTAVPAALGEMADIIGDIRNDDIRASEVIRRMRQLLQKGELESLPLDLNEVAQETASIMRPDAQSREIQLDLELDDGICPVLGDHVHLEQVVLNLLMNAVDAVTAMPPERRRVRVVTSRCDGEVRLAVVDRGAGIPADRLAEIFEPFYTTKSGGSGMGMGLAIARSIVEAHGGRMAAETNDGGGATVWFSVPEADGT